MDEGACASCLEGNAPTVTVRGHRDLANSSPTCCRKRQLRGGRWVNFAERMSGRRLFPIHPRRCSKRKYRRIQSRR